VTGISAYDIPAPDLPEARCTNISTDWFYLLDGESNHPDDILYLVRGLCNACPVQKKCLQHGVEYETHGIWGGLTAAERTTLAVMLNMTISSTRRKSMVTRKYLNKIMEQMKIDWSWFA
jgi:hypothetical protein